MALTFFPSQDSQTEPNVVAICAPRRWRRRSIENCDKMQFMILTKRSVQQFTFPISYNS